MFYYIKNDEQGSVICFNFNNDEQGSKSYVSNNDEQGSKSYDIYIYASAYDYDCEPCSLLLTV